MRIKGSLCLTLTLAIGGCPSPEVHVDTRDFAESANKIKEGLGEIENGLKGAGGQIDPFKVGELLGKNDVLSAQLASYQQRLASLSTGTGLLQIKDRQIILRIKEYSGEHTLDVWIDSPGNWAWKNRLLDYPMPTFAPRPEEYFDAVCSGYWGNCNKLQAAANVWGPLQEYQNSRVIPQFNAFKNGLAVTPSAGTGDIQIQESLLVPGIRYIYFQLTPRGLGASNHWFFRGQFVSKAGNGDEAVMKEFDLSDLQVPDHKLGTPIAPVVMMVKVEGQ